MVLLGCAGQQGADVGNFWEVGVLIIIQRMVLRL